MAEGSSNAAAQVLDELVHQFADAVSCFRELIQNAIDAGTSEVEVSFEFEPEKTQREPVPEQPGTIVAEVRDWGGGMDREVIEEKLTRLFSSAKEGDATKIGKFGIGFVSVFALEPEAVCVDTGRGGEIWRVLFDRERRFSLVKLADPLEGTRVRIFVPGTRASYEKLRADARRAVIHWCQHVNVELRFDGERVDRPLGLAGLVELSAERGPARIVVGHAHEDETLHGFYNGGITLEAGPEKVEELAGISFKVLAGDLEHTLTRDGVVRNEAFASAVQVVAEIVDGELRTRVASEVDARVRREQSEGLVPWLRALAVHLTRAATTQRKLPEALATTAIGRAPDGSWLTLGALAEAGAKLPLRTSLAASPTAQALHDAKSPVLVLPSRAEGEEDPAHAIRRLLLPISREGIVDVDATWALPGAISGESLPSEFSALREAALELLTASGHKVKEISLGVFAWPGSRISKRIALTLDAADQPERLDELDDLHVGMLRRKRPLVFNAGHKIVVEALEVAKREPELAACLLLKAARLEGDRLDAEVEATWTRCSWEARCRRLPT